jgi:arylsulfatase A
MLLVWLSLLLVGTAGSGRAEAAEAVEGPPNFVLIFADDLGYGDLGCYGHPTIRTPRLDRMAAEGMRMMQFYSASPVCTPSRAALLTGRLPPRSGLTRVLFPRSNGGIADDEITIAEALKSKGYATACVGKWHLGHLPQYLPMRHGFDSYYGIPYSNDMKPTPLLRNEDILEEPADQSTLTRRYTDEAIAFIEQNRQRPFFLYLAHTFPHVPLFSENEGSSPRGLYGDVVEDLDASTGHILDKLRELNLDRKTLVVFTSDNGPWLVKRLEGGSAGLLRDGKGTTWEGGVREPAIFWWPGKIEPGTTSQELGSTLDIFATFCALAGAEVPSDRPMDTYDLSSVLLDNGASPRQEMFYYWESELFAVRKGPWKLHLKVRRSWGQPIDDLSSSPQLYHLDRDPSEQHDVAKDHPAVVAELKEFAATFHANLKPGAPQR